MPEKPAQFVRKSEDGLVLSGEIVLANQQAIRRQAGEGKPVPGRIDARNVTRLDSWGVLFLKSLAEQSGAPPELPDMQRDFYEQFKLPGELPPPARKSGTVRRFFEHIGDIAVAGVQTAYGMVCFVGLVAMSMLRAMGPRGTFRFHSIIRHIDETGMRALPIIGLLAVLISMVISYQAAIQLEKFGANIFTIDLTVISLLREMGVLITAIMVAGRSGSAFAAEIGVMKLREEIDALKTIGMDPVEVLVLPRVIALVVTLPILTFLADIIGLVGGGVISTMLLDIPMAQYIDRVNTVATPTMFFVGMIKAPVFALIIAIVGTYQGMNVSGSAESVGRLTTVSVVQSIFMVIAADALFSILFAKVGI